MIAVETVKVSYKESDVWVGVEEPPAGSYVTGNDFGVQIAFSRYEPAPTVKSLGVVLGVKETTVAVSTAHPAKLYPNLDGISSSIWITWRSLHRFETWH